MLIHILQQLVNKRDAAALEKRAVRQFGKISRQDAKMKDKDAMNVVKLSGFAIFASWREIKLTHYRKKDYVQFSIFLAVPIAIGTALPAGRQGSSGATLSALHLCGRCEKSNCPNT